MAEKTDHDFKQMHLTLGDVRALLGMYALIMVAGIVAVIVAIMRYADDGAGAQNGVLYCIAMSLVGSSIYYVRKLYKALINESYTFIEGKASSQSFQIKMRRLGTKAFFVFRPIFGATFAVVVYAMWRLSLSASGVQEANPTLGFLFTTIALGFVSGFLAGRMLSMLEGYGARRLGGLMGSDG